MRSNIVPALIMAFLLSAPAAFAAPRNGFGVYVGVVGATEDGVISRGLSLGGDAQFVANDRWSFNPYLMLSVERSEASKTVTDGIAGIQARRWYGERFIGPQFLVHDRLIIGTNVEHSSYGPAVGAVAGVEYANGWGAEIQADLFEALSAPVKRNALRMHITYRWF